MILTNYLSDLLYRYDCVIVPDFGAFLTQKYSAEINNSTNIFLPPRKVISFNEQLKQNDGLLANHIVVLENISYDAAVSKVNEYVTGLKGKLVSGEVVLLPKIGHVNLNKEGNLQFSPLSEVNYLTSSFGLQSTHKEPVLREVYKEEVTVIEENIPVAFIPETREKVKYSYLKYAAIAVVALGASLLLRKGYDLKMDDIASYNDEVASEIDRKAYQKASVFDMSTIAIPEVTFNVAVAKKEIGKYHIIAGAFRFKQNADKKVAQLKEEGFLASNIGQNKYGLHQVVYMSVTEKEQAVSALKEIKNSNNPSAWLLVKEIN
jgi:hypothetical protein